MTTSGGDDIVSEEDFRDLDVDELTGASVRSILEKLSLSSEGSKYDQRERLRQHLQPDRNGSDVREDDLNTWKVTELREKLRSLNLKTTGNKLELCTRLKSVLERSTEKDVTGVTKDSDADDSDSISSWQTGQPDVAGAPIRARQQQPILSYKDVEDALESFSGDGHQNVKRWIRSYEETASLCNWTDVQMVIYAKRLLKGSAKLFIGYECPEAKSWKDIRGALLSEFSKTVNSKDVHRQLSMVRKKNDESNQEFIYRVLEMASHAEIEIEAKIQYIIDGVVDDEINKGVLYGASTIMELRQKFAQYEVLKSRMKAKQVTQDKSKQPQRQQKQATTASKGDHTKHCFNCGDKTHLSKDCPNKEKGCKCFICNEFGHRSFECPKAKKKCNALSAKETKIYKNVMIMGMQLKALIDSASDLHLTTSTIDDKIGAPELTVNPISFSGVGSNELRTLGGFATTVVIDNIPVEVSVQVVPNGLIAYDLILGGELTNFVEIRLKKGQANFVTLEDAPNNAETDDDDAMTRAVNEIMNIDVQHDESEIDEAVGHIDNATIRNDLREMIANYQSLRTEDSGVRMKLVLTDEVPVYQNFRRLSVQQRDVVNSIVADWIEQGVIRPSTSDYASPLVLVEKKDGSARLCVDYRKLNQKIIRDRFPMPLIENQLDRLQGARVFSTLDLKNGFFHVPVEDNSIKYTAFITPDGHYEFLRVPFGLCNSPAVFQRHIRVVFSSLIAEGTVLVYLDDLIVPAKDEEENLTKLRRILEVSGKYGLIFNWKKCSLLRRQVEYLGYEIEAGTVKPTDKKIQAVANFPTPTRVQGVHSFYGLASYFRKFIPCFSTIARPLSQLLKKDAKFVFGPAEEEAFQRLKTILTSKPVLNIYRPTAETQIHTDASRHGLGAILLQKNADDGLLHPVYYASWTTTPTEERYTSYELEMLAVIKALKKFRVYLQGIPFKIVTDCQAFALTMAKADISLRVARWACLMQDFRYTIEHRPGKAMRHADALSRNPISVCMINDRHDMLIAKIQRIQRDDPDLREVMKNSQEGKTNEFIIQKGVLYRQNEGDTLLVVPKPMQHDVIRRAHEQGHFGWNKTEHLIKREFWFSNMRPKVQKIIDCCVPCILAEKKKGKAEGLLNPIEKGDRPLDTYHVDHLGPMMPTKKRYNHIFAVVDSFSKFIWLYATKSTTSEEVIARLETQAATFGNPKRIIADRGSAFRSSIFKEYCDSEGIERVLITTGVPRGNGQVERINRTIIPILTKLSAAKPEDWYKFVPKVQQYVNASYCRSTGFSPFELLIGTTIQLKDDLHLKELVEKEMYENFTQQRSEHRQKAAQQIRKVQEENRRTYNRKRREAIRYKVGDLVAVKRTQFGPGLKLRNKFIGPYEVTSVLRKDRYLVVKSGEHEGPNRTSCSADHMKMFPMNSEDVSDDDDRYDDAYDDDKGDSDIEDDVGQDAREM